MAKFKGQIRPEESGVNQLDGLPKLRFSGKCISKFREKISSVFGVGTVQGEKDKKREKHEVVHKGGVKERVSGGIGLESLRGNTGAILDYLKENKFVDVEPNVDVMGHKGKKVHINLPAIGKFKGFRFYYFISDDEVEKSVVDKDPKLRENLSSIEDVSKLLQAMNEFMMELGGYNDGCLVCYKKDLKNYGRFGCKAGECLKDLTGLKDLFWLSDIRVKGKRNFRAVWNCLGDNCYFAYYDGSFNNANLCIRLSD